MRITNEEIRRRAGMEKISEIVQRWKWLGHVLRLVCEAHPRTVLIGNQKEGEKGAGHVKDGDRRTIQRELREKRLRPWTEPVAAAAANRVH